MSNESKDDIPAFPAGIATTAAGDVYHGLPGMSLLDWFAGQALAGILASQTSSETETDSWGTDARCAYAAADAMLSERAKSLNTSSEKDA